MGLGGWGSGGLGGYDLYVDGNMEERSELGKTDRNTKGRRVCPEIENQECILPQTSWGKRFQQHRKLDGRQENKGDRFRGNEEAEQLNTRKPFSSVRRNSNSETDSEQKKINTELEERNKVSNIPFRKIEYAGKTQNCGPRALRTESKLEI